MPLAIHSAAMYQAMNNKFNAVQKQYQAYDAMLGMAGGAGAAGGAMGMGGAGGGAAGMSPEQQMRFGAAMEIQAKQAQVMYQASQLIQEQAEKALKEDIKSVFGGLGGG